MRFSGLPLQSMKESKRFDFFIAQSVPNMCA
jgi:hypothetical protein